MALKTEVISQTYCSRDNLRLDLRFTFVNSGSETLILYRYGAVIARYVASKDLNSLAKGKYEYDVSPMLTPHIPPEFEKMLNEELVAVLKPGESFITQREGYLGINSGFDSGGGLSPGRYFMRLRIATWYSDPVLARELAVRWREMGTLWYFDVVSDPMEFTIKPYDARDTCD